MWSREDSRMTGGRSPDSGQSTSASVSPNMVDYVLVYNVEEYATASERVLYEKELRQCGLILYKEQIGSKGFVKICCPFDRLCFEAEQVKLEMPLKDCDVAEAEPNCWTNFLKKNFETDDEVDFVSAPFDRNKIHLFEGSENETKFFRSSLRSLLVHHMLINLQHDEASCPLLVAVPHEHRPSLKRRSGGITGSSSIKHGLPYLLMKGVYKDAFILHDPSAADPTITNLKDKNPDMYNFLKGKIDSDNDARADLAQCWTKWRKFQPLWKIRNYFGENIALYFAWQGLIISFLWLPAILGLGIFSYGVVLSIQSAQFQDCKCVFNKTDILPNAGDIPCVKKTMVDALSVDLLGVIKSAFNNDFNPAFSLLICLWGTIFIQMWRRKSKTLSYEWDSNNYEASEPDRPEFIGTELILDPVSKEMIWIFPGSRRLRKFGCATLAVAAMMCLVFLTIAGSIAFKVFMRTHYSCPTEDSDLTKLPVCQAGHTDNPFMCLLTGTILPGLMMASSVMLWGTVYEKVAQKLTNWENHQTQSDHQNALILKLFAFQFVNNYAILFYLAVVRPEDHQLQPDGLFGMGKKYKDVCPRGSCMSTLAFQILLLMIAKPLVKFFNDIIVPWSFKYLRLAFELFRLKKASKKIATIQEKIEDAIGTAPSEPPGGPTDSFIEKEWRKPVVTNFALEEFTEKVIQFGHVVVRMFAAAFPLAPFIALIVHLVDLRVDARRLLWFNRRPVAFIASDIGMWEPILSFLNFCGVVTNGFLVASTSSFADQQDMNRNTRLYTMLAFEHILFFAMYLLKVVISDTPSHVKLAVRREKYQVAKILEEGYIPGACSRLTSAVNKRLGLRKTTNHLRKISVASGGTLNSSNHDEKLLKLQPTSPNARGSASTTDITYFGYENDMPKPEPKRM